MPEKNEENILPASTPFVTLKQAKDKLEELIAIVPTGGSLFGISASFITTLEISTGNEKCWRMGVSILVPRLANMICARLAAMGVPGTRKRIEFVIQASADAVTVTEQKRVPQQEVVDALVVDEVQRRAHKYILLNGTYQRNLHLNIEMEQSIGFRDRVMKALYGAAFDATDFESILAVIRSELTGEPAFPNLSDMFR